MTIRPERGKGIALIAVLWLTALLTLLCTAVVALSVNHRRSVSRFEQMVRADLADDSAIRVALLRFIERSMSADVDLQQRIDVSGVAVDLTLAREMGRVDLNSASEEALLAIFEAAGWSEKLARQMVARIEDWKDADEAPRPDGAELAQYRAAGLSYGPRNGPFESTEEVRQVLGGEAIGPELLEAFTVYAHLKSPQPFEAPALVSRAFGWQSGPSGPVPPRLLLGEVVRVRACAKVIEFDHCRVAIIRLTGSEWKPFEIFKWGAG